MLARRYARNEDVPVVVNPIERSSSTPTACRGNTLKFVPAAPVSRRAATWRPGAAGDGFHVARIRQVSRIVVRSRSGHGTFTVSCVEPLTVMRADDRDRLIGIRHTVRDRHVLGIRERRVER